MALEAEEKGLAAGCCSLGIALGETVVCPALPYTTQITEHRAREYVRAALAEVLKAAPGQTDRARGKCARAVMEVLTAMVRRIPPDSGVTVSDLEGLYENTRKNYKACALLSALFAALETGFHAPHPFFAWAAENEHLLREMRRGAAAVARALEDDGYLRMRIVTRPGGRPYAHDCDCATPFCISLLEGFLASPRCPDGDRYFTQTLFGHFAESLGFVPESLGDFSPSTFGSQLEWIRDNIRDERAMLCLLALCRAFYLYLVDILPADQTAFTFETGLPPRALAHKDITKRWLEGYRCAVHEPLDPAPAFPKMIVYPNQDEALNSTVNEGRPVSLDCSIEGDRELEAVLVRWVWQEEAISRVVAFLPKVRALALDISQEGRDGAGAYTVRPLMLQRLLPDKGRSGRYIRTVKGCLRRFLDFCAGERILNVPPGCWLLLDPTRKERDCRGTAEVGAASVEHLGLLAEKLRELADRSPRDELTYIAFIVQSLTDLRSSEVLGLRADDIDAGPRNGVKAVRVCRKKSGKAFKKVQVSEEIHRLLQVAARITEPVRARADEAVSRYLFLYEGGMRTPTVMSRKAYALRLESACDELGIPRIAPANIRKRYITTADEEGLRAGISRLALRSITGHADPGSDSCYLRPDIMSRETREYLQGAFLVEIGVAEVRGEVLPDCELRADVDALVEGGAGVCRSGSCNVAGTVPCLMCRGFATSPRYIPEMLDAIATLEERIKRSSPHDREHLLEAKCVYLAYLGKMIDKEKEEQQNGKQQRG